MKRSLLLATALCLLIAAPQVMAIDTIGAYTGTNLGADLGSASSVTTTTENGESVTIHFFCTLPTDWSGEGADSGISYYEYQVHCPGFASASYHDPSDGLVATYDGTLLNVSYNPGTGAPLIPDAGNGGHIYLGYLTATVPTSGTTVNVAIKPYPGSTDFDGDPMDVGPGIKNGANAALMLSCCTSTGADPAGTPDWDQPVFVVNGEAPVGDEITSWSQVKALFE